MPEMKLNSSANIQLRFVWRSHTHNITEEKTIYYLILIDCCLEFIRYAYTHVSEKKRRKEEEWKKLFGRFDIFTRVYTHTTKQMNKSKIDGANETQN